MYNDGVTILYFNTADTKGGSDDLKKFLEYLEKSEPKNAVTSASQEMQGYVEQIKHDAEIGGNYMTFVEHLLLLYPYGTTGRNQSIYSAKERESLEI